jgi:hypothetical protein
MKNLVHRIAPETPEGEADMSVISSSPNARFFPFENSTDRRHRGHKERHLLGVGKHCFVISRSKRTRKSNGECLTKLARIVIDVVIAQIYLASPDQSIVGFVE